MDLLVQTCAVLSLAPGPGASPRFRLAVPGDYHGHEVKIPSGEGWLGLFITPDGTVLRPVDLVSGPAFDPYFDDEGEASGLRVTAAGEEFQPLLVLLPPADAAFAPGPVESCVVGSPDPLPDTTLILGDSVLLEASAKGVILQEGAVRQRLSPLPAGLYPEGAAVVWAGDLDGDGRIDLVLDERPHYAFRFIYRLFLSSGARPGRLVEERASVSAVSC